MSALVLSLTGVWISAVSAILMYSAFSPQRISGKRFWLAFAVCTAARLPIAYATTGISGIFRLAIGFAPLLLMHCLLYTGSPVLRLFVTVSFYSWSICMDNLVFTAAFTLIPEKTLLFSGSSLYFVPAILVHILILLLCSFVKKLHPYRPGNSVSTVGAAVSMGISLLSIAMTAVLGDGFQNQQISPALLLFCAVFSSCVNIGTFCLISWLEQAAQLKQENLMLQVQMKAQKDSVEALGNSYAEQRKLTHDFNAHIDMLHNYLAAGEIDDAKSYAAHLKARQTERVLLVRTHNHTMDALLNQKGYAAQKYQIDIRFSVNDLSGLLIAPMDMTVVMNNLLDNAIEACQKVPPEGRSIYVQLILKDALFLSVRNTSLPVTIVENTIATTKSPAQLHGFGLQNVKTVLEKYQAFFTMRYENGYFSFAAELPNMLAS